MKTAEDLETLNPNDPNRQFRQSALEMVLLPSRQQTNWLVRISDLLHAIDRAARYHGFYDEEIEYRLFLKECANAFGVPLILIRIYCLSKFLRSYR